MLAGKSTGRVIIEAVVTRADGTVEDLGTVCEIEQKRGFLTWLKKLLGNK